MENDLKSVRYDRLQCSCTRRKDRHADRHVDRLLLNYSIVLYRIVVDRLHSRPTTCLSSSLPSAVAAVVEGPTLATTSFLQEEPKTQHYARTRPCTTDKTKQHANKPSDSHPDTAQKTHWTSKAKPVRSTANAR